MSHFYSTIKKMQDIANDIANKAKESMLEADEETREKITSIANKTIDVISEAAIKLKATMDKIDDDEKVHEFLDRVEKKCIDAKEYAFKRIEELTPEEKEDKATMENYMDNENVANITKFILDIKDSIVDFYNSPSTKHKINEAKLIGLGLANKGLDIISNIIKKDK